jgi:hypothetical protein
MNLSDRSEFIADKGFAKVDREVAVALAKYSPLLEVGAGTGYLTKLLLDEGCDAVATDRYPPRLGRNPYGLEKEHVPVKGYPAVSAVSIYPGRSVIMSWPPMSGFWSANVASMLAPGLHLIYIGEGEGGCTGTHAMFKVLETEYDFVEFVPMEQWHGLHDSCHVYRRK